MSTSLTSKTSDPEPEVDWAAIKARWMLDPEVAHLNHGAFGAVPSDVQRLQNTLRDEVEVDPTAWFTTLRPKVTAARGEIARFLGSAPSGIALVHNASAGASTVLACLPLKEGDEVLCTNHGYGAVTFAAERACRRVGADLEKVHLDRLASSEEIFEAILGAVTDRTRLVVLDHVTSPTARRFPIERLVPAIKDAGAAVLVDAAHGPGMYPIELGRLDPDYWVGNLHKWCCAPRATAALYASATRREGLSTLVVSWLEREGFPDAFDMLGTMDLTAWLAAPAALEMLGAIGWERLRGHNSELVHYGQTVVADALGVPEHELVTDEGVHMAVVPLRAGIASDDEAAAALRTRVASELHAEVSLSCWEGRGLLRLSAHAYNVREEYERLAMGLRELLSR